MWNGPTYDCQLCGACCVKPQSCEGSAYAYLTPDESKRMRRLGLAVIQETGDSFLSTRRCRRADGSEICVAFQGGVGEGCGCTIYADRPRVCRDFQVGSPACEKARRRAGMAG